MEAGHVGFHHGNICRRSKSKWSRACCMRTRALVRRRKVRWSPVRPSVHRLKVPFGGTSDSFSVNGWRVSPCKDEGRHIHRLDGGFALHCGP